MRQNGTRPRGRRRGQYVLRLYVAGMSPRSTQAVANLRAVCEKYLSGRYDLEVIDLYRQPELARTEQLVAAPTLVKKAPLPRRRMIGDMSSEARLLAGLDLPSEPSDGART